MRAGCPGNSSRALRRALLRLYTDAVASELSLTGKRWLIARQKPFLKSDDVVQELTRQRGLTSEQSELSDPFLFPEMRSAVQRIHTAVKKRETVGIFGDYDADGITGVAQLVRFFRRAGIEPVVFLPHRERDGYGVKQGPLEDMVKKGVTLLITVDTGITAQEPIAYASSKGMDVIVTDHHTASARPPAFAVIHPRIPKEFPNPHLCGSGVVFMLLRALEHSAQDSSCGEHWLGSDEDLLLATIGTIGDLVPLVGENRLLVQQGLRHASKLPPGPLRTFIEQVKTKSAQLRSTDVAYRIVPRINASGRMDHPKIALDALLGDLDALDRLHALNSERQDRTEELVSEAQEMVDTLDPFLCIISKQFPAGIVGLIAGNLAETYGRPALVATLSPEGMCTASVRSMPGFDLASVLAEPDIKKYLTAFGGHAQAAGCSFTYANFPKLKTALCASVLAHGFRHENLVPSLTIDAELPPDQLTLSLAKNLQSLEPFGQSNREPAFLLSSQHIADPKSVGADGTHLQLRVGKTRAIGFGLAELLPSLAGSPVDLACSISINAWKGREDMQLIIKDIRCAKTPAPVARRQRSAVSSDL